LRDVSTSGILLQMRFFLLFLLPFLLFAEDSAEKSILTEHVYSYEGEEMPYVAALGTLPVIDTKGKPLAHLFYIAYFAGGEDRPLTFVFPGGPGGACGIEAICTVGPKRLKTPKEGKRLLPPYELIDNPESLLPWTDLVFVDPVGTGYSKIAERDEDEEEVTFPFFSTDGDIAALGKFIYTFLNYYERWNSPKYVAGISYGAARSCGLSEYLLTRDISLHGILLLSPAIDYATLLSQRNHPLPDAFMIPTFAATAWYHGRLFPNLPIEEVVDYARRFCYDDYIPYMLQRARLSPFEQGYFYKRLSHLIGLKEDLVRRYSGRFDEHLYTSEFLAAEKKILGGLDTRYSADWSGNGVGEGDPSYKDMQGAWCAFRTYLQKELKLDDPFTPYVPYFREDWDFSTCDSIYWPELFQRVRRTLVINPEMKIFTGSGYYDCRTPFAATEYCFDHLDLPISYRKNLQFSYYEGGHGFVFDPTCLKKLKDDILQFYSTP